MNAAVTPCAPAKPVVDMNDQERSSAITVAIKKADRELRRRWSFLKYQDAIGLSFFLFSTTVTVVSSLLYIQGVSPWWACLVVNAICLSVLREIEHDLIHNLYFATRPFIQNLLMLAVWPFLGNLPHPWYRRRLHLLHHRTSGQDEDFEERLIGNGMKFGPLKVLAMIEPGLASLFRRKEFQQIPFYNGREFTQALFPVAMFYLLVWYSWVLVNAAALLGAVAGLSLPDQAESILRALNTIAVVFMLPNLIRQVSVQTLSSCMHYFGDVDNRLQETHVLNAWWWLPFNLFACNFGSTHTIHHFVVNQPFYVRQLVARQAHAAFRRYGVRYNDTASIFRRNRYHAG